MKKILILGASFLQLPLIKKAKELGLIVAVADMDREAVGVSYADEFYPVSTIDVSGIVNLAREIRPDGITTAATDMPIRAIAAACFDLKLPSITIEAAINSTDKFKMIECFSSHSVPCPKYYLIKDEQAFLKLNGIIEYPYIVKPTDNAGSRGVRLVKHPNEALDAYRYALSCAHGGRVLVEEFLEGREISVEGFIYNNELNILSITDKLTTKEPYFVELGHSQYSNLEEDMLERVKYVAERAVKSCAIDLGPVHVEIMITKDGPFMIELGARMGGDCITSHLVPLSSGIDMLAATILASVGDKVDLSRKYNKGSAVRYIISKQGRILDIIGIEKAREMAGVKLIEIFKKVGDKVSVIKNSGDRVGLVITEGKDAKQAVKRADIALNAMQLVLEE